MAEVHSRMVPTGSGKRIPIRLDAPTWQAVELVAKNAGKTWQQWCLTVIQSIDPETTNITAAIRERAIDSLLEETVFANRAEQLSGIQPVGLRMAGQVDDKTLKEDLAKSVIESRVDCAGFSLKTGIDPNGHVCFWIENGLRDGTHIIVRTPFTPEKWKDEIRAIGADG